MKVIYIESSPMGERSFSARAAGGFLNTYREKNPAHEIVTINLWEEEIPYFDGNAASGKYKIMRGLPHEEKEKDAWEKITKEIKRFASADRYVISSPMWNFGIPFRLKQYLDVVIQPGFTFSFSPEEGYRGLLTGKRAVLFLARGGEYGEGSGAESFDFQKPYLELALGFMGIEVWKTYIVEPTLGKGEEAAQASLESVLREARKEVEKF